MNRKEYWRNRHAEKMRIKWASLVKTCKRCSKDFRPPNDRFDYCSDSCQREAENEQQRAHNHLPEIKQNRNSLLKRKRKNDREFWIKQLVHRTVMRYLSWGYEPKWSRIAASLPFLIPQLKAHLESQFNNTNGFTWENHGTKWELDHIVPQAMFHFTTLDEKAFRDCWALKNLRPLACRTNLLKGYKCQTNTAIN